MLILDIIHLVDLFIRRRFLPFTLRPCAVQMAFEGVSENFQRTLVVSLAVLRAVFRHRSDRYSAVLVRGKILVVLADFTPGSCYQVGILLR